MAVDGPQSGDHSVGTGTDRRHRLAAGTAVAEEIPAGPLLADVGGAPALVVAVIPLLQLWGDLAGVAEARQLARPAGPRQRAHQDLGECYAIEPLTQAQGVLLTARRERDVRPARVPTGDRPCRLTMPRQVYLRQRCVHDPSFDALHSTSGDGRRRLHPRGTSNDRLCSFRGRPALLPIADLRHIVAISGEGSVPRFSSTSRSQHSMPERSLSSIKTCKSPPDRLSDPVAALLSTC